MEVILVLMKRLYGFTTVILGLIIIGTITAPKMIGRNNYDIGNSFAPITKIIETDKETYQLGERIETQFMIVNNQEQTVYLNPIAEYSFSGNSINNPRKISAGGLITYVNNAKIEVNGNGNITFHKESFKPKYPGEFVIEWLGIKKTVEVTGFKEVTLHSEGISLDLITNQTSLKKGDRLNVFLIVRNDNPYPVKIPVITGYTRSTIPITDNRSNIQVSCISSHYEIEANSYEITWHDINYVRPPGLSLFFRVDGIHVDIQLEVTDERVQIFDPIWVGVKSEGMSMFLEPSIGEKPTILIQLRNDNSYPVRIKPFSKIRINNKSLNSSMYIEAQVGFYIPFWDIPAHSTKTIYNTDAYASETRTPIFYTLYNQTLRYPQETPP